MAAAQSAKKGLGRGLSALLGDDAVEAPGVGEGRRVPLTELEPNPDQPRKRFAEEDLATLAESIGRQGLLQPIVVRSNPRGRPRYEIIAGERRWRAAQRVPLHDVPVVVKELDDAQTLEVALVENLQRVDLNPIEEAESYQRLIDAFSYTQAQMAETIGKSRSHVANTLRLLTLPSPVRTMVLEGQLSAGHARAVMAADDPEALANLIVREGLSVRAAEKRVSAKEAKPAAKPKQSVEKTADTRALEADLSATLGMPVDLSHAADGSGTVTIRYNSLDALDNLCEKIGISG